jgi:hypothetical protein
MELELTDYGIQEFHWRYIQVWGTHCGSRTIFGIASEGIAGEIG